MSNNLPPGWTNVAFEEIIEVNPRKSVDLEIDDTVTFVPMAAVSEITGSIVSGVARPLSEVSKGFTQFIEGDVLFAKITPSMENGKSAVARDLENGVGFGSTEFHVFRSYGAVLPDYIWYFIRQKSFREDAQKVMSGAVGQQRVPADYLKAHRIPLPPLAEQGRIVEKVCNLMRKTERARSDLENIPGLVEKLKSQLIKAAISGELTENWRKSNIHEHWPKTAITMLQARRDSYEKSKRGSRLQDAVKISNSSDYGMPGSWIRCCVADVADLRVGYAFKSQWFSEQGVPLVRGVNIAPGRIDWSDTRRLPNELAKDYQGYQLEEGDIVLAMDRPVISTGLKIAIVDKAEAGSLLVQRVANPRPTGLILNKYLYYIFNGPSFVQQIQENATGSDLPHISGNDIKTTTIDLPPIDEQTEIISIIEGVFGWLERVIIEHSNASRLLPILNSAIYEKAFSGRLVPQDPRDEPASALVGRVAEKRSAMPQPLLARKNKPMIKNPKERILQDSESWPDKGLPFTELAKRIPLPHDIMRDALFALLAERNARIRQVFDTEIKCMHLKRVKS